MKRSYLIQFSSIAMLLLIIACAQRTGKAVLKINANDPMPNGAWTRQLDKDGKNLTEVLLLIEGYYSLTAHESANGAFVMTKGGSFKKNGMNLQLLQEFHSAGAAELGVTEDWSLQLKGAELSITTPGETVLWQPLDVGQNTPLTGAWLFSGRESNGEMQRRDTDQPRKTMKLLTGTRFQWIAFNTETGEFFGTGGGEYSADGSAYIEKIRFFSRNNDRVGAELPFEFRTEGTDWHHTGKSSAGDPMHEIWTKRLK